MSFLVGLDDLGLLCWRLLFDPLARDQVDGKERFAIFTSVSVFLSQCNIKDVRVIPVN